MYPSRHASTLLPVVGSTVAERYHVVRRLAEGGMGIVYEAKDTIAERMVALKVLRPEVTSIPDVLARFEREANLCAKINNPHVVRVFNVGATKEGVPFYAMELLEGSDLATRLNTEGRLPISLAVNIVRQMCEGVAAAHKLGVVHRDLKPSNVFLVARRKDEPPLAKVVDFGVSKLLIGDTSVTMTNMAVGTPLYMSPEQVRNSKRADERTDVWAMGVILFQLLTGRPPFEGESAPAVAAAIVADQPLSLKAFREEAPMELAAVINHALQKRPGERIQTAVALRAALLPFDNERFTADDDADMLETRVKATTSAEIALAKQRAARKALGVEDPQTDRDVDDELETPAAKIAHIAKASAVTSQTGSKRLENDPDEEADPTLVTLVPPEMVGRDVDEDDAVTQAAPIRRGGSMLRGVNTPQPMHRPLSRAALGANRPVEPPKPLDEATTQSNPSPVKSEPEKTTPIPALLSPPQHGQPPASSRSPNSQSGPNDSPISQNQPPISQPSPSTPFAGRQSSPHSQPVPVSTPTPTVIPTKAEGESPLKGRNRAGIAIVVVIGFAAGFALILAVRSLFSGAPNTGTTGGVPSAPAALSSSAKASPEPTTSTTPARPTETAFAPSASASVSSKRKKPRR